MVKNILFFLGGAFLSWFFTHIYYKKNKRDSNSSFDKLGKKLSEDVIKIIIESKYNHLTVKDLISLLKNRVLDDKSDDLFKYKACPLCGSQNLFRGVDYLVDEETSDYGELVYTATEYPTIECLDCGWKKTAIDDDINKII